VVHYDPALGSVLAKMFGDRNGDLFAVAKLFHSPALSIVAD